MGSICKNVGSKQGGFFPNFLICTEYSKLVVILGSIFYCRYRWLGLRTNWGCSMALSMSSSSQSHALWLNCNGLLLGASPNLDLAPKDESQHSSAQSVRSTLNSEVMSLNCPQVIAGLCSSSNLCWIFLTNVRKQNKHSSQYRCNHSDSWEALIKYRRKLEMEELVCI